MKSETSTLPFRLSPLPYAFDALEPVVSAETLEVHYDAHHRGYVENLNKLLPGSGYEGLSLTELVEKSEGPVLNQAAQAWNHDFYWKSMTPKADLTTPDEKLVEAIRLSFGNLESFRIEFEKTAHTLFGSGWLWLVTNPNRELSLLVGNNAENPLRHGLTPLIVCDLWEHAYYIDYRSSRNAYVAVFLDILNWNFANENFRAAQSSPGLTTKMRPTGKFSVVKNTPISGDPEPEKNHPEGSGFKSSLGFGY